MGPTWLLIVDDDDGMRGTLADLFRLDGYTVMTATNGQEALLALDAVQFDALLVDLSMPVMDGFELRRILQERGSETPFIVMTAAIVRPEEMTRQLDAATWILKPFDIDTVLAAVDRALTGAREVAT